MSKGKKGVRRNAPPTRMDKVEMMQTGRKPAHMSAGRPSTRKKGKSKP